MVRISAVSYLNTKPFLHGLEISPVKDISLSLDMPSEVARKLLENEVDLGLIPVAVIPLLKEAHIIPGYCIGADGPVESVKLYSHVPLPEIKTVLLDYQSRTSVTLVKVLAAELWNISPEWKRAEEGFEEKISGTTAGVVIGDRTFTLNGTFQYEFDLAEEWKNLTGLPFVFACWVSNKPLPKDFIRDFSASMEAGLKGIQDIIKKESIKYRPFNVENYLLKSLNLRLDQRGEVAIGLFLEKLKHLPRHA
ncbi:MAG TPA: menaquinone biosynthesis protein [Bacteroidia bacterium]|nr:menaquinone biosynthesis protein [Bacteroidia bacterium]